MDLCRGMLNKKRVLASKSHRGKQENMWKQFGNNFEQKKILKFFWNFWGQKFRKYVILYAQKMDFLQLQGGVKKFLRVLWKQTKIPVKPET